jgi:FMN phosphatase YigB (HAD superfamily)
VFDTLLHRTLRAERSRILRAERSFAEQLGRAGWQVTADTLIDARMHVQRLTFRALEVGRCGEARLTDIIARQLRILGLPEAFVAERLRLEIEIERESLSANRALAELLRARRAQGVRVIALSDTTLSASQVQELLDHFHGPGLVDHVYSSADLGQTKRAGGLFVAAAKAENVTLDQMLHLGDDVLADVSVPASLGVQALHVPRPKLWSHMRSARGLLTETGRQLRAASSSKPLAAARPTFAHDILGPILTRFCQLIWLYVSQAEQTHKTALLFCARGGIGIREAFEQVVAKQGLPLSSRRANLMVSRLVAARSALMAKSPLALEELGREFPNDSFARVASALGGRSYELPEPWQQRFVPGEFLALLHGPSGAEVLADITEQSALFERHLRALASGAERLILIDTGLYGSTQRLLAQGFPDLSLETVQFARSNYKGFGEEHFPRTTGLMVQDNFYNPLQAASSVLRYWHLVESFFEPRLQSVRWFELEPDGSVSGNCGPVQREQLGASCYGELLSDALQYIQQLTAAKGVQAFTSADSALLQLKRAITRPSAADIQALTVGTRSKDFGRDSIMEVLHKELHEDFLSRLKAVKKQHWREGAISRGFPMLKHALLPALSSAYVLRRLLGRR